MKSFKVGDRVIFTSEANRYYPGMTVADIREGGIIIEQCWSVANILYFLVQFKSGQYYMYATSIRPFPLFTVSDYETI